VILIRECQGHDELEACVRLQVETWGYDQSDVIPRKAFLVMQKIGGQIIGACVAQQLGLGLHVGDPAAVPGAQVVDDRRAEGQHQRHQRGTQDGQAQLGA